MAFDVIIVGGGIVGLATAHRLLESKPDLNSLINKPNETDTSKNDVAVPADTSFKSSISDGPNDEKTNEQLALDKEPTSLSSSNSLFIFLGVLFAIFNILMTSGKLANKSGNL